MTRFENAKFPYFCIEKILLLVALYHISVITAGYLNNHPNSENHYEANGGYGYGSHGQGGYDHMIWDDLRITWGPNASFPHFQPMPKYAAQAERQGWKRSSINCYNGRRFYGIRYAEPGGYSGAVSLLYDIQGTIAGIQMSVPLECAKEYGNPYAYEHMPMFLPTVIGGEKHVTLTVYFIPPLQICTRGRSYQEVESQGIGTGLWIQNGYYGSIFVPRNREIAQKYFGWSKAQCVPTMGYHSFYDLEHWDNTQCRYVWPFSIIGDKYDNVHGFVFMLFANCKSQRFEHIPQTAVHKLMNGDACPKCADAMMSSYNLTTMHVYFKKNPLGITCG